jgi:hypothetical protein
VCQLFEKCQVVVIEGGQWLWPTVEIGHTVELRGLRFEGDVTTIRTVSMQPAVFEVCHPNSSPHVLAYL